MLDLLNTSHRNWPTTFYFQPKLVFEGKQVLCGARCQIINKLQQSGWWNIEPVMSHPNSSTAYFSLFLNFNGNKVVELLRANIMRSIWIWDLHPSWNLSVFKTIAVGWLLGTFLFNLYCVVWRLKTVITTSVDNGSIMHLKARPIKDFSAYICLQVLELNWP